MVVCLITKFHILRSAALLKTELDNECLGFPLGFPKISECFLMSFKRIARHFYSLFSCESPLKSRIMRFI